MTDAVVISGATAVPVDKETPAPLLTLPDFIDVAVADPGTGVELLIRNATDVPLRIAVEGVGDISIPRDGSTTVPLLAEPGGPRLHLQGLSAVQSRVVMVLVSVEPSDDGPIAVGHAIGAPTC